MRTATDGESRNAVSGWLSPASETGGRSRSGTRFSLMFADVIKSFVHCLRLTDVSNIVEECQETVQCLKMFDLVV